LALCAGAGGLASGCRNPDVARLILEGPEGSGLMGSKLFRVLAVYQASEAQRREAEAAARAAEARLVASARAAGVIPPPPEQGPSISPTPAERAVLPPVLVVPVTEPRRQGAAAVMIWDTRTASLSDANVYDLKQEPPAGRRMMWKTSVASVQAVYVGAGLPN
jgi:hypothetical protein